VVWLVALGFVVHSAGELTPFRPVDVLPLTAVMAVAVTVSAASR
jgi:hypothetical protein